MHSSSGQIKASRLRSVRALAGLTRKDLEQYGISSNTLRMWENPDEQSPGLTNKGANRIVDALKKSGIVCSVSWLLNGTGDGPTTYNEINNEIIKPLQKLIDVPPVDWGEDELILKEIDAFCKINPNATILRILDDSMEPLLCNGDYVGGYKKNHSEAENYIGSICIIELTNHTFLCRRLDKKVYSTDKYILSCMNPYTQTENPVLFNIEIKSIAQVVWIRKKESRMIR